MHGNVPTARSKTNNIRLDRGLGTIYVHFQNVLNGSQESIQCLAVCACDLIILFVYCCCGELVSDACDISNTVYQLHWYNYDNQLKYAIRTVIRRTQKSYKFSSCAALNCSLETFAQVCVQFYFYLIRVEDNFF